jgi:hypothetical protein
MSEDSYVAARSLLGKKITLKFLFISGAKMVCNGFISVSLETETEHGAIVAPCTIRWSGYPTFTPST